MLFRSGVVRELERLLGGGAVVQEVVDGGAQRRARRREDLGGLSGQQRPRIGRRGSRIENATAGGRHEAHHENPNQARAEGQASTPGLGRLLRTEATKVVDDVPQILVRDLSLEALHHRRSADTVGHDVEDLAVGVAVIPLGVSEV